MKGNKKGLNNERGSLRINIAFDLNFIPISDAEFEIEKRRILTIPTTDTDSLDISSLDINEKKIFKQISSHNPDMALIWQSLNKKLDLIISTLNKQGIVADDIIVEKDAHCIDLSGKGISITVDGKFRYGQLIKLFISPPCKYPFTIMAIGKIMRIGEDKSMPGKNVTLGIDFMVINEVDREHLITYIFKRHREYIRSKD